MEVRIGVVYSPKELTVEVAGTSEQVVTQVEKAMADKQVMIWFLDEKGRRIGVPLDKVTYVEVGEDDGDRRVGFGR